MLLIEHIQLLHGLGVAAIAVRKPEQLTNLDGLIIPGGESTTMGLIAERWALVEPLASGCMRVVPPGARALG